jgi:hypothetical protein
MSSGLSGDNNSEQMMIPMYLDQYKSIKNEVIEDLHMSQKVNHFNFN